MSAAAAEEPMRWGPQPGPQTAFARCNADIVLFGGAAGGGKSFSGLYEAVKWSHVPGYRAILFRRTAPELTGGGGLWDESQEMYRAFGGRPRGAPTLDWVFESGARIEFRHLHRERDVYGHQGRQYAVIVFDEVTHFTPKQFWYMVSRLRSTCGVRPYVRATCNPDPDSFVRRLIAWWIGKDGYPIAERSGVLRWFVREGDDLHWHDSEAEAKLAHPGSVPMSFTFIASRLADNRILTEKDPTYRAKLLSMGRVDRARLLGDEQRGGNWDVRAESGLVFARSDFKLADSPPARAIRTVRFWDKAASEPTAKHPDPDWTRGVRVSFCEGGRLWIDDIVSLRKRGTDVLHEMRQTAESDGMSVTQGWWQDTGGAGKTDVDTTLAALAGYPTRVVDSFSANTTTVDKGKHRSSRPKRAFAAAWAPWVERGSVYVLRGEPWTEALLSECDGFPDAVHDDIVDAISGAFQVLVGGGGGGLAWWDLVRKAAE